MKLFKQIDVLIQVVLLILLGCSVSAIHEADLVPFYFILGAWQVTSLLIHAGLGRYFYTAKGRNAYAKTVLGIGLAGIVSIPFFLAYLFTMLVLGPVLACWYISICWKEIVLLQKKAFIHLKR
ncbi:MAG: hypothetical protein EOO05_08310 [Chitinophagaceae bacterium]|nr:MAG: hypothetical protein EOO05_08310 [Chitinophagaceae bacterium]